MNAELVNFAIRLPRSSDRAFSDALVQQIAPLRSYAKRLTGGATDWDDLLQETLLRCWKARESFCPGTHLTAWSRTVMRNCFFSHRRRTGCHVDLSNEAISDMLNVAEHQSAVVNLGDVVWALGKIAPNQREAIELLAEGITLAEGAVRLGITESALKSRACRARRILRLIVEDRAATSPLETRTNASAKEMMPIPVRRNKKRNWAGVMIG